MLASPTSTPVADPGRRARRRSAVRIAAPFHLLAIGALVGAYPAVAVASELPRGRTESTAEWLTEPERSAFDAFGADVIVGGKAMRRAGDPRRLDEVAARAPDVLGERLRVLSTTRAEMVPTPEEVRRYDELLQAGIRETQLQLGIGLVDVLFGRDAFDATVDTMDAIMKNAQVVEAWKLQSTWLERALAARERYDDAMTAILDGLRARSAAPAPTDLVAWTVGVDGGKLVLDGKVGAAPISEGVLHVLLHKPSTNGGWTQLSVLSGVVTRAIGITAMGVRAQGEGARLAIAQERAMNLPLDVTLLVPEMKEGTKLRVRLGDDLVARAALGLARIELHHLTEQGCVDEMSVVGLSPIQERESAKLAEERAAARAKRFGPTRPASSPTPATPADLAAITKEQAPAAIRSRISTAASLAEKDASTALDQLAEAKKLAAAFPDLLVEVDKARAAVRASLQKRKDDLEKALALAAKAMGDARDDLAKRPNDAGLQKRLDAAKARHAELRKQAGVVRSLLAK